MNEFRMVAAGVALLLLSFMARSGRIAGWLFSLGSLLVVAALFTVLANWLLSAQPFNPIMNGARF